MKPMRYWNGRDQLGIRGPDSHTYICARSKAEAIRIGTQAFANFSKTELNNYFSEQWGYAASDILGEQTEPGLFISIRGKFFKQQ